jgi:hypothetical protein
MRLPSSSSDRRSGVEHSDGAGFVAVALLAVNRLNCGQRLGIVANGLGLAAQGRPIVFQLNDQMRLCGRIRFVF